MEAKTLSLISKCVAVVYALTASIFFGVDAVEIVIVAAFVAEAFITVDISMITKNIKKPLK